MSQSNLIAIDAGHGYTKALSQAGSRVIFPSLIAPQPATLDLGEFGKSDTILIDEQPYLVGEDARQHATPLWTRDKADDEDTLRLILVAAAKLGLYGPVHLATGLPLAWYGSQRKAFRDALMGFGGVVELAQDRLAQRIWFESVVVLPQGVAAAVPVLANADTEIGSYLVVDVGYRTTDYIIVTKSRGGELDYDPSAAGSLEIGMHAVTQEVAQSISDQYQVEFSAAEVEGRTQVTVRGQKIDMTERTHAARQAVGQRLAKTLAERLGPQIDKLVGIVAVGGGSALLSDGGPGVIVPAEPQWANANGYLLSLV